MYGTPGSDFGRFYREVLCSLCVSECKAVTEISFHLMLCDHSTLSLAEGWLSPIGPSRRKLGKDGKGMGHDVSPALAGSELSEGFFAKASQSEASHLACPCNPRNLLQA